ncbi:MAG: hypothetical protein AAF575_09075 [Bacteroidota bacterium]|nr:hypothetical protein [uncultured Allomuricauda sp.]
MRNYIFSFFALFIISSILAPSVLSLMDESNEIVLLKDTNEEENNNENETEKQGDEKDMFLKNTYPSKSLVIQFQVHSYVEYELYHSDFIEDILLPPPRLS